MFMKTIFTIITFIFLSHNYLFSHFDMILADDPILEDIRFLSLESRSPFLSFTPPLSSGEIRGFLDRIDRDVLSSGGREAYNRVRARLTPVASISYSDELFSLLFDLNSTVEGIARFNSDISLYPRYSHITPLISAPLRMSFANMIQLYFEPIFAVNSRIHGRDVFGINIPTEYDHINHDLSIRAFGAIGGNWWNFQIGRDRLFWGTAHTGSLTFSDNAPHFDFARLSLFSSSVKYSVVVNQMPLRLTSRLFPDPGSSAYPSGWDDPANPQHVLQRYFYLHRLDFRLFNRLSIGIMEGIMVGNSSIELRYLNPIIFFHSLFAWNDFPVWAPNEGSMVGSFASVEFNWNIINNLSLYGQVVMNEFTLPGETDEHPNALGYLLGIQFAHSFGNWRKISFLELIYTDPYLFILSSPFASFIQMDRLGNYFFIGHPRDTISLSLGANFFYRNILNLSTKFSWIASGQHNDNDETNGLTWDWERGPDAVRRRTPTGTAENKFILSLAAGWQARPWLQFNAGLTGIVSLNNNHISGNNQIGGQASFSVGFRY